ncbi:MAG: aromatic ring-hydroxylating dioxygenase subunit alpha [Burkholderiaceae bacterium]
MIPAEQNRRLTQVGPQSPGGRLLRQYWHPIALVDELDAGSEGPRRPVVPVRALGQDFVLFRDDQGRPALLDRDCPHRGADLSYGRLEHGGLRCPFHGWLFNGQGMCLETPGEPPGSQLHTRIRQRAYPVRELNGSLFAWFGDGEPPAMPALDCFNAPASHSFSFKGLWSCNWLQALEVGIDPVHASFLHRFFEDEDSTLAYGRQFRSTSANSEWPMTRVLREYSSPEIRVEATDYGMRLITLRPMGDAGTHVRVTNQLFPNAFVIPLSETMTITQWHLPVDDHHNYWHAMFTSFDGPIDHALMREQRLRAHTLPDYVPITGAANRYGFSAADQQSVTYTGLGNDINVHDQWAVESLGAIQDRTREHLGTTDKAIMAHRRALLNAMDALERGERPLAVFDDAAAANVTGPMTMDGVCPAHDEAAIDAFWRSVDARRRSHAVWIRTQPVGASS